MRVHRPKWKASTKVLKAIELASLRLKAPKEWASFRGVFTRPKIKVSSHMLYAGPVGAYFFQFLDIDEEIKRDMIHVLCLLELIMRKSSIPRDRAILRKELPVAFTRLELALPVYIQTAVVHYLVYHAVDHLEETGPFHVTNMLDTERFQTVFKSCAKGKKHMMQSIVNNYQLLQSSLNSRLQSTDDWAVRPCESSTSAYLHQANSADRADRFYTPKGAPSSRRLADDLFVALLKLWRIHSPEYSALVDRFEAEQKNHRKNKRLNCLVSNIADWRPTNKLLTPTQLRWVTMQSHVKVLITVLLLPLLSLNFWYFDRATLVCSTRAPTSALDNRRPPS
jgi:hypothetical protein